MDLTFDWSKYQFDIIEFKSFTVKIETSEKLLKIGCIA